MGYQVLARKYRPQNFDELIGQEQVTRALRHALDHDRLHHAYLFTGTRGVGKTTVARILARCLNCEQGISATPCGDCSTCRAITEGRFFDLIEVDAASRTGIDDTRELLDNVQYAPSMGRFKVYLIDEVHMLSMSSFNALLKTLEEPPPHVKFLLATTDPQKMPITVLSRCLQFNLKMLPVDLIADHLADLLQQENITFEAAALSHLGRAAAGSMRDALSLADQAIAYGDGALTEAQVRSMLGSVDRDHVQKLLSALADAKPAGLLQTIDDIFSYHPDALALLDDLISHFHQLAVQQLVPARGDGRLSELAARFSAEALQLYYDIAVGGRGALAELPDGRSGFEMLLLRMLLFRPEGVLVKAPVPPQDVAGGTPPERPSADQASNAHTKKPEAAAPTATVAPPQDDTCDQSSQPTPTTTRPSPSVAATQAPPQQASVADAAENTAQRAATAEGQVGAAGQASVDSQTATLQAKTTSSGREDEQVAAVEVIAAQRAAAPHHDPSPPWDLPASNAPAETKPASSQAVAAASEKSAPRPPLASCAAVTTPASDAVPANKHAVDTTAAPHDPAEATSARQQKAVPSAEIMPAEAPRDREPNNDSGRTAPRADNLPAAMSDDDFAALSESADLDSWWYRLLPRLAISGSTLGLAANSRLLGRVDNCWRLAIVRDYRIWMSADKDRQLVAAFSEFSGEPAALEWQLCSEVVDTPALRAEAERAENQRRLLNSVTEDKRVIALQQQFDARLIEDSIRPLKQEPHHGF